MYLEGDTVLVKTFNNLKCTVSVVLEDEHAYWVHPVHPTSDFPFIVKYDDLTYVDEYYYD